MFCMNCGQQLPDGAKFCLKCGTPQGAVSPSGNVNSETINLDGNHSFVPAMCPNCNAHMEVDSGKKIARCNSCGTECLVQEAIKALSVNGNVNVGNASINVNGSDGITINAGLNTESLLKRVEILLKDGSFNAAMDKCEQILDSAPTNGEVYLYMLMASLKCRKKQSLIKRTVPFSNNKYYLKAMEYGDEALRDELQGYISSINEKAERIKKLQPLVLGGISWKVIEINCDKALIISDSIVCTKPNSGSWKDSIIREWLNNTFVEKCFRPEEKDMIIACKAFFSHDYSEYDDEEGEACDRVFLLSENEVERYFNDEMSRACHEQWWLRSVDGNHYHISPFVHKNGSISNLHCDTSLGVRPAMWIKYGQCMNSSDSVNEESLIGTEVTDLKGVQEGSKCHFGMDGCVDLIWEVLKIQNGKALLFSADIICYRAYNGYNGDVTWAGSSLREWLNSDFLDEYFSSSEKSKILSCKNVFIENSPKFKIKNAVLPYDKAFLLSVGEVNEYFPNQQSRGCGKNWWLRSTVRYPKPPDAILPDGEVAHDADFGVTSAFGVRPAMWIKIDD